MFGEGVRTMKVTNPEDSKYLRKPSNLDKLSTLQDNGSRKTSICKQIWNWEWLFFNYKFKAPVVEDDSDQNSPLSEDEGPVTNMTSTSEFQSDPELNLSCCIVMLDILLKQVKASPMQKILVC